MADEHHEDHTWLVLGGVPVVPEGENPYEVYSDVLHTLFYPEPSSSFMPRMIVFWVALAYGILMSIAYLAMTIVDYRRRDKKFWVYRLVRRPPGRYIVSNQNVLFAICAIVNFAILTGYVEELVSVYVWHGDQSGFFYWRNLINTPLIVHVWIASWGNFQAAVLASQKATKHWLLSPIVSNSLYIGAIVGITIALLVVNITAGALWEHAWHDYSSIEAQFRLQASAWNGTTSSGMLQAVQQQYSSIDDELNTFVESRLAVRALYLASSIVLVILNVAGITLVLTLRKQLKFNTKQFQKSGFVTTIQPSIPVPEGTPATLSTPAQPSHKSPEQQLEDEKVSSLVEFQSRPHTPIQVSFATDRRKAAAKNPNRASLTTHQLKKVAKQNKVGGKAEQARQILALRRVHYDMIIFVALAIVLSLTLLATSLKTLIAPESAYKTWSDREIQVTLVPALYVALVDIALTFLVINGAVYFASKKKVSRVTLGGGVAETGFTSTAQSPGLNDSFSLSFSDIELSGDEGTDDDMLESRASRRHRRTPSAQSRPASMVVQVSRETRVDISDDRDRRPRTTSHSSSETDEKGSSVEIQEQ